MSNFLNRIWIIFLIIFFLIINLILALYLENILNFFSLNISTNTVNYIKLFFMILFSLIIMILIYTNYIKPLKNITKIITGFLAWLEIDEFNNFNKSNVDISFISRFFNQTVKTLQKFKTELKAWKVLKTEVDIAAEVQKWVLHKKFNSPPSLNIVANSKSASEVWWDSYDVITTKRNSYIYLWDVAWHWVASWIVMMMVNTLIRWLSEIIINSSDILIRINKLLKPRVKSNMLMSLIMLRWNINEQQMYMTWAWHEYLLIYKKSENKTFKIKSWWIALWMLEDVKESIKEVWIKYEEWDIIVLYSDWITESRNWAWNMFGVDRIVNAIDSTPVKSSQWVFNNITIKFSEFVWYNFEQKDDISLMVIYRKDESINLAQLNKKIPQELITDWNWR